MTEEATCPICGTSAPFAFETRHHRVNRCPAARCGHLFACDTSPAQGMARPDNDARKDYSVYEERNTRLIRYWQRRGFIHDGRRILDIGSGTGHILRSLRRMLEVAICAVEPQAAYHAQLRQIGCSVYAALADVPAAPGFDAALMIETLEHFTDPVAALKAVNSRLNRNAALFLTTPAGDRRRPTADPSGMNTYALPEHLQFFTPRSLELALRSAGFRAVRYRFVPQMYPASDRRPPGRESVRGRWNKLRQEIRHRCTGAEHLTYFARA